MHISGKPTFEKYMTSHLRTALFGAIGYGAFEHFLPDHPSGSGLGLVDFGIVFTEPVAQSAMTAYDDIWQASEQIQCATLIPTSDRIGYGRWFANGRTR